MARDVWPFRRPAASAASFCPWVLHGAEGMELPEHYEGWDPLTNIVIERDVTCNIEEIRLSTGLTIDDPLVLSVSWVNNQSFMAEGVSRLPLTSNQHLRVELPAGRIGGSLTVKTVISVGSTDSTRPLGVARYAGSVLLEHRQQLVLEGTGPMLPMATIDFAGTAYPPNASWALQIPQDLDLATLGTLLLLVNSGDSELIAALTASSPSPRQVSLMESLEEQMGALLISTAACRQEEVDAEVWPEGSVGELLSSYAAIAREHDVTAAMTMSDVPRIVASVGAAARAQGFGRRF